MKTRTKIKKRKVIPIGIFLLLFITLSILCAAILSGYFYFEAKRTISGIEKTVRYYTIPLAEASANLAELSYKNKNYSKLKKLFREKIQAEIIDEAFFVLSDGTIIVHSDKELEKELKGNIATDEFAYNVDLIMLPVWSRTDNVQFMDYHIYDNDLRIPFRKDITLLLKKYIYKKIDVLGWLVTRAVFYKGKSIGCVSFLISKDRIYKFLLELYENIIKLAVIFGGITFCISLIISVIVFARYRSLSDINPGIFTEEVIENKIKQIQVKSNYSKDKKLKEAIKIKSGSFKKLNNANKNIIKDAISVNGKQRKIV